MGNFLNPNRDLMLKMVETQNKLNEILQENKNNNNYINQTNNRNEDLQQQNNLLIDQMRRQNEEHQNTINQILNQNSQILREIKEENKKRDEENKKRDKIMELLIKAINDPNNNSLKKQLNHLLDAQENNDTQTDYSDSPRKGKKKT